MKRTISLFLAVILFASTFAVAANADTKMYQISLPADNERYIVAPVEGYELLIAEGEDFAFYIEPIGDYSLKAVTVAVNGKVIFNTDDIGEYFPPGHKDVLVYKIDTVTQNITITVENVMTDSEANFFEWLINFLNGLFEFFSRIFGGTTTQP